MMFSETLMVFDNSENNYHSELFARAEKFIALITIV